MAALRGKRNQSEKEVPEKHSKPELEEKDIDEEFENEPEDDPDIPMAEAKNFPPYTDKPPSENTAKTEVELFGVRTTQNHRCTIGGKSYVFKAGERVMVPFNVKCVLSRANLLRG